MGRLDIGHYQAKDGETRTSFDVWADEVQAMSRALGPDGDAPAMEADSDGPEPALAGGVSSLGAAGAARSGGANGRRSQPAAAPGAASEDLEDLPF